MDSILTQVEARVVGSLIEKELTTPQYYPLTVNALTNACNQKSNRNPVMSLEETTVQRALQQLMDKGYARRIIADDSRVPKYRQLFTEAMGFDEKVRAVVGVLLLRGPQTVGEIRGRTERLYKFESLDEVSAVLDALSANEPDPYVQRLPRQPGTKEARVTHLFCGEVEMEEVELTDTAIVTVQAENERIDQLEQQVSTLQQQLSDIESQFAEFRKQFE